jgi:hypothetical protein
MSDEHKRFTVSESRKPAMVSVHYQENHADFRHVFLTINDSAGAGNKTNAAQRVADILNEHWSE